ncbi:isopenicillin N synthase family dioxygenase [Modestobacter versicolor]|uniref:Isopenicillin N synthase family oxygenase n=1 Tax=Modestobacter versicolor TaxID=429133 RepID=A0A323V7I8_9ACTN|nr:2OG-Fe(II) oxygenase family protein [Modestobacter versicolor]MBB3676011.1 isopenicillin N synthase-like dioxygenase [Modestobacter versicolor]PZA20779.1 isopenicillin N synthase family oxygenase [Modestobacter versicolor]
MTTIPVIDLTPALTGGDTTDLVTQLHTAMSEVGFLQVVGHGVSPDLVTAAHDSMDLLDSLPAAERRALIRPSVTERGLNERVDDQGRVLGRTFKFLRYDDLAEAVADGGAAGHPDFFTPNVWPAGLPVFRETWRSYLDEARRVCDLLMGLVARALGMPADHFDAAFAHSPTLTAVNWYPPQPVDVEHDETILRPHPDSGGLTVLHQSGDYEGLEVLRPDGSWTTVPIIEDAFVINIGQLMSQWTNGVYPATIHRVVAGPTTANSRRSIAVFHLPDLDTVVEPLPSTVGAEGPRFAPISVYDWQQQFMARFVQAEKYAEPAAV